MHLTHAEAKALGIDLPTAVKAKRFSSGKRPDLDNRYFRSVWEANYARYLNWLVAQGVIARWEYEVDEFQFPIKRGCRFYKPDFKVWEHDGSFSYHEVKGWLDGKSSTKLKRMARYFPAKKIVLIDRPRYYAIAKQFSKLLAGWEKGGDKRTKETSIEAFLASKGIDVSQHVK